MNIQNHIKRMNCSKDQKNVSEKNFNTGVTLLNTNLTILKSELSIYFTNNLDSTADEIKEFYVGKFFPQKNKPKTIKGAIPTDFTNFIDYYIKEKSKKIEGKQDPITEATRKKLTTIKNRITIFDKKLQLKNINDDFRDEVTEWMQSENYSSSTIIKDLKYIKTVLQFCIKKES